MTDCIVVGGAACVWEDLLDCPKGLPLIAVNKMIGDLPFEPYVGATLHWDRAAEFRAGRRGGFLVYSRADAPGVDVCWSAPIDWHGSSGLYAVWVALQLGFTNILLAGIPIDASPHYYGEDAPALGRFLPHYREGWLNAQKDLDGRVRSMSGWTKELLGGPEG